MSTASLHISCVLICPGISLIQHGTDAYKDIFTYILGLGQGPNFMDRKNDSLLSSISAFLIVHLPLIFVCLDCPRLVLNEPFLMTYAPVIFCTRHLVCKTTKQTSQSMVFNDVFTTYLQFRGLSQVSPQPTFF